MGGASSEESVGSGVQRKLTWALSASDHPSSSEIAMIAIDICTRSQSERKTVARQRENTVFLVEVSFPVVVPAVPIVNL